MMPAATVGIRVSPTEWPEWVQDDPIQQVCYVDDTEWFGDAQVAMLADAMVGNTSCKALDISLITVTNAAAAHLARVVRVSALEEWLHLPKGLGADQQEELRTLCKDKKLTRLSIQKNRPVQRLLLACLSSYERAPSKTKPPLLHDVVELVAQKLAEIRDCPYKAAGHRELRAHDDVFAWHYWQDRAYVTARNQRGR